MAGFRKIPAPWEDYLARSKHVDSKNVEKAAVLAVMNLIQPCESIDYSFTEDDKNMLVDGTLQLFNSSHLTKEHLFGEIDVQIKGALKKLRVNERGFAKYPVSIVDLRKYQEVFHGVLFFCVSVDTFPGYAVGRRVFYAQLLPYDISNILSDTKPSQKTVKIRFKPFPTEPREIVRLTSAFHADQERQRQTTISGYGFMDKKHELPPNIKSFSFSTRLFPGEDVTSLAAIRNGAYIYGEDDQGQSLVFGKVEDACMFAMGREATVGSGDFSLETLVYAGEHVDGSYIEFEGINLIVGEKDVTFNFMVSGDFHKRYNTVRFASEFIRTGVLSINGSVALRVEMSENDGEQLRRLEDSLKVYGRIVATLDSLGITAAWDPSEMTEREVRDIDFMHHLLVERKPLTGRELESPLVHFDIQGGRIYAFAREDADGSYEFVDVQSDDLFFVLGWPDEKAANETIGFDPVPPIVAIGEEGFKKVVNLSPDKLSEAFERFPVTEGNQGALNQRLLEMLSAYDSGCQQPNELLASAALLARKLYELDPTSDTYCLNLMQTLSRKRLLDDDEKERLRDMALDSKAQYVKASAYALLGNQDMAVSCLNRCSEEERRQVTEYPIAALFPGLQTS